jgi:hypothetical protein
MARLFVVRRCIDGSVAVVRETVENPPSLWEDYSEQPRLFAEAGLAEGETVKTQDELLETEAGARAFLEWRNFDDRRFVWDERRSELESLHAELFARAEAGDFEASRLLTFGDAEEQANYRRHAV